MAAMFHPVLYLSLTVLAAAQPIPPSPTTAAPPPRFVPLCDPANFTTRPPLSDLPVPDLPDQFSFILEQNEEEFNASVVLTLYYDGPGNRGRLETRISDSSNNGVQIFDYTLGEVFAISGAACSVSAIEDDPYSLFGIDNQNGTRHIGSPRIFLEGLGEGVSTRYLGEEMVRGIRTQHWQACRTVENLYSNLNDYYFAIGAWDYAGQGKNLRTTENEMVPVQFTQTTIYTYDASVVHGDLTYYIVDFRAGPESVPDSLFRVPNGLACTGRFPGQSVPEIPPFFSTYVQLVSTDPSPPIIQSYREFYDLPHKLFRIDVYGSDGQGGIPAPLSLIHDLSTSVQYFINNQANNCSAASFEGYGPYLFDLTTDDSGTLQLVSPNNFFFLGNEFNYSYEGVSNIRGVDVDSWVSIRDFEKISLLNYTDIIYEVFFTRPGWIYATDRSINTDPVPWRIKFSGSQYQEYIGTSNTSFEMDLFDFSTDEPPYDAFDISSCSVPEDFYTMILIIPGQERGIDLGQLRKNIRTSVTNYTGLRPLQIGNIQIVSENGTHIFVTFQISNLTSLAKIDPARIVTAQQAVDYITSNTVGSQLPFRIQISPNVSVTPSLRVAGRGPTPTACNDSFCDCSVPLVDPDGTCSTPNCATPPDIPSYFSVTVQQIDQHTRPPSAQTYKEFYDYGHNLFRFDTYYDGSSGGPGQPVSIIHDLSSSVQYVIGNQFHFCFAQPLEISAPFFWDITTDDGGTLQLISPNNIFFRGPNYSYTYQGATNVRGVDVDSWLSYRSFEQIAPAFNLSDAYYQVFFTRPGWSFPIVQSVTDQPVPWRIIINGTVSALNRTDSSIISYFTTFYMDLYEFSTDEPPYDVFDISSCSAPDDYHTLVLFIPGNETGIDFGQLRRNIRTSVTNYTGLRPLQIGNIQIIRENGTHFAVTFQISNLSSLVQIDPSTNVTAQQAVDLITGGTTVGSNQLPFQIQISPNVMVTPTFFVLGRVPEVNVSRCENSTNIRPEPCNCTDSTTNNNTTTRCPNTTTDSIPMSCNCSDCPMANTTCPNVTNDGMCPECNCSASTNASECTFNVTQCENYCSQNNLTTNVGSSGGSSNTTVTNITNRLGLSSGAVAGIAISLFILGIIVGVILQLVLSAVLRYCRKDCTFANFGESFKYKKQEENISLT